jgi:hypothetical protein
MRSPPQRQTRERGWEFGVRVFPTDTRKGTGESLPNPILCRRLSRCQESDLPKVCEGSDAAGLLLSLSAPRHTSQTSKQ